MQSETMGLNARMAALSSINNVLICGKKLSTENKYSNLELQPEERAMASRLTSMVLRNLNRADCVLKQFLNRTPQINAMNVLRLMVTEFYLYDLPHYTAVDQAVRLMKSSKSTLHLAKLANAVMRKVVSENQDTWNSCSPQKLPEWMDTRISASFGVHAARKMEIVYEKSPPIDITARSDTDAIRLASKMDAHILPTGSLRLEGRVKVSNLPEYTDGSWWVQDAAAALPVKMLGLLQGKSVLDLCAAPGGKSMQCMSQGANVTMLDISKKRIETMHSNLNRCQFKGSVHCINALDWNPEKEYDVVLVDPPCSATGTIRRNPDLPHRIAQAGDIDQNLIGLQEKLLNRALSIVKTNGLLLYSVCSLMVEEGEQLLSKFVQNTLVTPVPVDCVQLGIDPKWRTEEGGIRLRPDYWSELGGMDGFYAIVLKKLF